MFQNAKLILGSMFLLPWGSAHAALIDRGGGLIYDDVLNVTWLQDAGYAVTSGLSERLTWEEAMAFADGLEYWDSERNTTITDWRLPSTVNASTSEGFDTTGLSSELAYMYYVNLGYAANTSFNRFDPAPTSSNYNPFINLAYRGFWSGTPSDFEGRAWAFHFHFGAQQLNGTGDGLRVWLLRDGDVANSVPEPGTAGLLLLGLVSVGWRNRLVSKTPT